MQDDVEVVLAALLDNIQTGIGSQLRGSGGAAGGNHNWELTPLECRLISEALGI